MEYEMKRLLERIPKEKHEFALQTLAIIASIKDECKANRKCEDFPKDWNEYDLTERIYK